MVNSDAVLSVDIRACLVCVVLRYYGATNHDLSFKACCTDSSDSIVDLWHGSRHQGTDANEGSFVIFNGLYDNFWVNVLTKVDDFVTIVFEQCCYDIFT